MKNDTLLQFKISMDIVKWHIAAMVGRISDKCMLTVFNGRGKAIAKDGKHIIQLAK